jgi:putative transcriptional regulator
MDGLKGRLLVAAPVLGDENFDRTVVLLLEHGDEGALGVVLNRPSGLDVSDPLPEWSPYALEPEVVFIGGPVSRSSVIALARFDGEAPASAVAWEHVLGPVGVVDLSHDPVLMGGSLGAVRVFAGYAGWGPGQLEGEIAEGAWYVVAAEPGDVFTDAPTELWRTVLARQPGDLARVARVPMNPGLN